MDLRRLHDPLYLRHSPNTNYKLGSAQNANDQLFQAALSTNLNEDSTKKSLTERLASILDSTAKKLTTKK